MIVDGRLVDTGPIVQGYYPVEIAGEDVKKKWLQPLSKASGWS